MTHVRNESNRLPTRDGLSNLRAHQLIPATAAAAAAGRCRIEIEFEMQILKLLSAIGWPEFSFACERAHTQIGCKGQIADNYSLQCSFLGGFLTGLFFNRMWTENVIKLGKRASSWRLLKISTGSVMTYSWASRLIKIFVMATGSHMLSNFRWISFHSKNSFSMIDGFWFELWTVFCIQQCVSNVGYEQ